MPTHALPGRKASAVRFPLGGLGTGCVSLAGDGRLVDWELFNRPAKGSLNGFSHLAIKAERGGRVLDARVLHGPPAAPLAGTGPGPYQGFGFGLERESLAGLPHFRDHTFHAEFPFAALAFRDPDFPGRPTLRAFNPFIPLEPDDSGLPAAFLEVGIANTTRTDLDYTVAFTLRNPAPGATSNRTLREDGRTLLHFTGTPGTDALRDGDFALATDAPGALSQEFWYRGRWFDNLGVWWRDFTAPGPLRARTYAEPGALDHGTLAARVRVPPGAAATVRFVLAWHVPRCADTWSPAAETCCGGAAPERPSWKNHYATRFDGARAVALHALGAWDRLEERSRAFSRALHGTTIPAAALDAVASNLAVFKSPTCLRLEDGSFYGWEGCHADAGCCEGTCTHVWNYAVALPFLFPSLARSVRELEFRHSLRPDGGLVFRLKLPPGSRRWNFRPCADGQYGAVLGAFREWRVSGDTPWLRALWPEIRACIAFAWNPDNEDRWDPGRSGVLTGRQHHTLDMEFFGPSSWLTSLYLAALEAGAVMAEACGDAPSAAEFRAIAARGRAWVRRHLFRNGHFIQRIDLGDEAVLAPYAADASIRATYWSDEHGELKYQVGEGCGIDQVLGQWHADLLGLGDVLDPAQVRSALRAIHRHNFIRPLRSLVNPCRLFGVGDEAGTVMFSWPGKARRPVVPVPYAEETMHGFEYQAASHLILRGLVDEGLAMAAAVRERYDGVRRNPWNEIECGSHYARSLASYALLHAWAGIQFDLTRGALAFRPVRAPRGTFRTFWCLGTAWGVFHLRRDTAELHVLHGGLTLQRLGVPLAAGTATVRLGTRAVPARREATWIAFDEPVRLQAGDVLRVRTARTRGRPRTTARPAGQAAEHAVDSRGRVRKKLEP